MAFYVTKTEIKIKILYAEPWIEVMYHFHKKTAIFTRKALTSTDKFMEDLTQVSKIL